MSRNTEIRRAARGRPRTGAALSAAERMRRMRARRKAAGLKAAVSWVEATSDVTAVPYSSHRLLEARSLALHAVIAEKIQRDPDLLNVAQCNLDRWRARWGSEAPVWLGQWAQILKRPWPQIAAFITDPGEKASRLRQSSPFAGVLDPAQRKRIYEAFRA